MSKLLINDTADVVVKRKSDGHLFLSAETQLASISQTLGINEKIWGSIGNKPLAVMRGQKEVTSTLRNAFYDPEFLAMTQGVSIDDAGGATVYKREDELKVTENTTDSTLEVTITGTPKDDAVYVRNTDGTIETATATTGTVTVPTGLAEVGDLVSVTYQEEVLGSVIEIDSQKFAEAYTIEYHTIAYSPVTNQVVRDIYIQLDHVVPQGDFELSFENGSALAPEFTFDALTEPNSTKIGRIAEIDRNTP